MTALSRLFALYPAFHLIAIAAAAARLLLSPSPFAGLDLLAAIYLLPLACYRLLRTMSASEEGLFRLGERKFNPWWAGHQIQALFIGWPFLEVTLRLIPGLYSLWLRAWGSRVGRRTYWTPRVEILDRGLMEIGDDVIFGHKVECFAHVLKSKNGRLLLYVRRISIGSSVFIGAGSRMAPGIRIPEGSQVPLLTDLYPNQEFSPPSAAPAPEEARNG